MEVGSVVRLKSGGPRMTVEKLGFSDAVLCVWFDRANQETGWGPLHRQWFVRGQLLKDY